MSSVSALLFGIFLIAGVIYLYLGGYLIYENIRECLNRIFALVALSLAIWAISFAMAIIAQDVSNALLWRRISTIGWGLFYALMLHFIIALLINSSITKQKKYKLNWKYLVLYIPSVINIYVFGFSTTLSEKLYNLTRSDFGWRNIAFKSIWDTFFNVYYISYSITGIALLVVLGRRTRLIREKKQSVIITTSFIVSFLAGSLTDIVFDYFTSVNLPESGILFLLLPIISMWIAIKKYGLMRMTLGSIAEDILSRMNEGLLVLDYKGCVTMVNHSLESLIGYALEELREKNTKFLFKIGDESEDKEYIWSRLLLTDLDGIENYIISKNGNLIPVLFSSTRIIDQWGEFGGVVCIITNLSEIKERETSLLITQNKLEVALQKANVDAKAKSQFLSTISHELRTPMNSIIGMSYLTLQTNLNNQQESYVNKIQSAAKELLTIVNEVLDFSKMEDGKMELEQLEFDVNSVISKEIGKVIAKADEKQLRILYHYPKELNHMVIGDSVKLGEILSNLLNNAVKFTEYGEIEIGVVLKEQTLDNICLQFWVRDTGIGISEENSGKLFKLFTQVDSSTTRQYGGIGLGLAISQRLVEMMNGHIWVESKLGKGSKFEFTAWFRMTVFDIKNDDDSCKDISKMKNTVTAKLEESSIIDSEIAKEIDALLTYLKKGNSLAQDMYCELSGIIKKQLSSLDYTYIDTHMKNYEFDEAYERLNEVFYGKSK